MLDLKMNMLVLFALLATAWPVQAAALPSVVPARVPTEEEANSSNNLERENYGPPTLDVVKFVSEGPARNLVSDVAQHVAEQLDGVHTRDPMSFISGYSVVRETGSEPNLLSRVKRARKIRRNQGLKKQRHTMGGKFRQPTKK